MKEKVLVIEAHSDDSAISIGGFLEKFKDKFDYHFALAANSDLKLHHYGEITKKQRSEEYQNYVNHFGGTWHQTNELPFDNDAMLDTIPKKHLVGGIEKVIDKVEPDYLICQGPSFHHDHFLVYEAVIAATRPTSRHFPKAIYIMENPTYVHSLGPQTDFKPNLYIEMDEKILKAKMDNFKNFFPSQIRDDENYLSEEGIRSWARYRGIESRCRYAEALQTYIRVI